jgi:hypothetical protein
MALTLIVISIAPYHRVCTRYFFLTITDSARSDTTFFSRREFFHGFSRFTVLLSLIFSMAVSALRRLQQIDKMRKSLYLSAHSAL